CLALFRLGQQHRGLLFHLWRDPDSGEIISSKAFNPPNPQFYLTFVNKYIVGYIDLNIHLLRPSHSKNRGKEVPHIDIYENT
ncbi:hypothetical protein KC216_22095, partial [Mycobacterium tuberculosis]|uniref:hypothetical protein n=1 Tax=Mycobacterium tuberculosis TaxID=1773 RepID=UPI001B81112B